MRKKLLLKLMTLVISLSAQAQLSQQWHYELNGAGDFNDQINSIALDNQGNAYLAGYSVNIGTDRDYLIMKVNNSGAILWSREFSAPGNGPDEAKKVLILPNGNIIVTGYGNNKAVGNDFWTMALNPSGDTLWTSLHNSSSTNLYDEANDMAIDTNGNIFIVGDSDNDPTLITNHDYMIVKLAANGSFLWEKKLNGSGNAEDRCVGVDVDSNNDIYVTGRSSNGFDDDFLTMKYTNAGILVWTNIIDNGGTDRAVDIEVGSNNNIYVTGRSDNGTDDDYHSIVYSTAGAILAESIYDYAGDDRPVALTTFPNGDFAVTGKSDGNITVAIDNNAVTVKFNSSGNLLWSASFSNVALADDLPTAITSDASGNVAITGFTDTDASININNEIFVAAYNSAGVTLSTFISNNGPGVISDDIGYAIQYKNGNTLAVGGCYSLNDIVNAQSACYFEYSITSNSLNYSTLFNGGGDNTDNVRDIAVDAAGNSYVCGYTVGNLTSRDFFVAKVLTNGTLGWRTSLSGTLFGSDDEGNSIKLDNAGNVYVSGFIKNSGTSSDISIMKFNAAGVQQWSILYDGLVHESDKSFNMHVDGTGNVFLTGKTDIDASWQVNDEVFTAKYSTAGALLWSKTYTGVTNGLDKGQFIRVSAAGNVYVVGKLQTNGNDNVLAIKYNNTGTQVWAMNVDVSGGNDKVNDFALDASENLIVCGSAETSLNGTDHNCFTLLINSAGVLQWQHTNGNAGIDLDENIALYSDNTNIYVAQNIDSDAGINENISVQVQKYDNAGVLVNTYNYTSNLPTVADDILIDNYGTPLLLAHTNTAFPTDIDYRMDILKVNSAECVLLESFSTSDSIDVGNVFTFLPNQLFIGGSTWHYAEQRNAMVVKYNFTDTQGVANFKEESTNVYPNPFASSVQFSSTEEILKINIYSIQGELVETQFPNKKSGVIDLSYLPDGAYIIQGQGKQSLFTKQLIKQ
jgi:uncharacterized delta-60 repeat protein